MTSLTATGKNHHKEKRERRIIGKKGDGVTFIEICVVGLIFPYRLIDREKRGVIRLESINKFEKL